MEQKALAFCILLELCKGRGDNLVARVLNCVMERGNENGGRGLQGNSFYNVCVAGVEKWLEKWRNLNWVLEKRKAAEKRMKRGWWMRG